MSAVLCATSLAISSSSSPRFMFSLSMNGAPPTRAAFDAGQSSNRRKLVNDCSQGPIGQGPGRPLGTTRGGGRARRAARTPWATHAKENGPECFASRPLIRPAFQLLGRRVCRFNEKEPAALPICSFADCVQTRRIASPESPLQLLLDGSSRRSQDPRPQQDPLRSSTQRVLSSAPIRSKT